MYLLQVKKDAEVFIYARIPLYVAHCISFIIVVEQCFSQ